MLKGRLKAIYDIIDECGVVLDIGTDHAYIPIECVETGKAARAVAADVRQGPVNIARANINERGLGGSITTALADGFDGVEQVDADCVVIAGMGGTLISEILSRGVERWPDRIRSYGQIVLQPMNDIEDMRRWLSGNGFRIVDEAFAEEPGRIYSVIKVLYRPDVIKPDKPDDETDILIGPVNRQRRDDLTGRYVEKMKERRIRMLDGFKRSEEVNGGLTPELENERKRAVRELEILTAWQERRI